MRFMPYNKEHFTRGTYAYGYLANPWKTNVIMLDFDSALYEEALENILATESVTEIDVVVSSRDADMKPKGFHIYAGLNGMYNVIALYRQKIPGACKGYLECVVSKQEMVLRASRKFNKKKDKDVDTRIIWAKGYSRKDKNTWLSYGLEQLTAPLTTADGPSLSTTLLKKRPPLRLRG